MEAFCRPPLERTKWKPIPRKYIRQCAIQESPTTKNLPYLQKSKPIDYSALEKIVTETNLEFLTTKQRSETLKKYIEWLIPIHVSEPVYTSSKTYAIGVDIYLAHFLTSSKDNTRRFIYDSSFLQDLENLCYADGSKFIRQKINIEMFSQFLHLMSPEPLQCSLNTYSLISLVREGIADIVRRPSQLNQVLHHHFESIWLPNLYSTIGSIQFPCPNGLRLWLSTLTFDTHNEIIIFPSLENKLINRLWASTNSVGTIFDNYKIRYLCNSKRMLTNSDSDDDSDSTTDDMDLEDDEDREYIEDFGSDFYNRD